MNTLTLEQISFVSGGESSTTLQAASAATGALAGGAISTKLFGTAAGVLAAHYTGNMIVGLIAGASTAIPGAIIGGLIGLGVTTCIDKFSA